MHRLLERFESDKELYLTNTKDVSGRLRVWDGNRKPDAPRVSQILQLLRSMPDPCVPGLVYAFQRQGCPDLVVYDGAHRCVAAQQLLREHGVSAALVLSLMSLGVAEDDARVHRDFQRINSGVAVPSAFVEDSPSTCGRLAQEEAARLALRFPRLASASSRPRRPGFNRDALAQALTDVMEAEGCASVRAVDLQRALEAVQRRNEALICTEHSEEIRSRACANGCALMLFGMDRFKNALRQELRKCKTA
jgi:hypothetical protein